jgi:MFS family permease
MNSMHKVYIRAFANDNVIQISGFLAMPDFLNRFGENGEFTPVREGTIVGLLSIGTLLGAIIAAPIADKFGRRMCILVGNIMFWIGMIVQMSATHHWYQVAIGRWVAGLGVGALSVLTPMYMSVSQSDKFHCIGDILTSLIGNRSQEHSW